jgi:hypothetical protein
LKLVLQNKYKLKGSWLLFEATSISHDGTKIVGRGQNPDGKYEAWIAILER